MASYTYNARMKKEYREMFDAAVIRQDGVAGAARCVASIEKNKALYEGIAAQIGCPWWFVGLIHGMEIGFAIGWLANGDSLSGPTKRVPAGLVVPGKRPPFDFVDAAVVSLKHKALEKETDWSLEHCLYLLEAYNGFGYRSHGDNSDYLWSFTNFEKPGRYVADGEWDPTAMSGQIGCVAMLKGLISKGLVEFEVSPQDPGIEQMAGWFEGFRIDQNGQVLTGLVFNTGADARVTWEGVDIDAFIAFRKRFPNASNVLIAPHTKAWPGNLPKPEPKPEPAGEVFLKITRPAAGRLNSDGLEDLRLELMGTNEAPWLVQSGRVGKQTFEVGGRDSGSGTGFPCPQGEYVVRDFRWYGGKDNWNASGGAGLGPMFVPFDPKFDTGRGAFGIHWDSNHPKNTAITRESPSAGSAGCLVHLNLDEHKRLAAALRKHDPRRISVQWGL